MAIEQVAGSTAYFLHHDQLGSTRAVTDASGSVQSVYTFDAYGNLVKGAAGSVPLLYAGQYRDSESGLYYLRARYYDSVSGEFVSMDPMVSSTGSSYVYVERNPLNAVDPSGMFCAPWDLFNGRCDVQIHTPSLSQLETNRKALANTPVDFVLRVADPFYGFGQDINARWQGATDVSNTDLAFDTLGIFSLGAGGGAEKAADAGARYLARASETSNWHFLSKGALYIGGTSFNVLSHLLEHFSKVGENMARGYDLWRSYFEGTIAAC